MPDETFIDLVNEHLKRKDRWMKGATLVFGVLNIGAIGAGYFWLSNVVKSLPARSVDAVVTAAQPKIDSAIAAATQASKEKFDTLKATADLTSTEIIKAALAAESDIAGNRDRLNRLTGQGGELEKEQQDLVKRVAAYDRALKDFNELVRAGGTDFVNNVKAAKQLLSEDHVKLLKNVQAMNQFLLESADAPTIASQGLLADAVIVRWRRATEMSFGTLLDDYTYAIWRSEQKQDGSWTDRSQVWQVKGDKAFYIDKTATPGIHYKYAIYRSPPNPKTQPAPGIWLTQGPLEAEGWAGSEPQP